MIVYTAENQDVVVIEDDNGNELARLTPSDARSLALEISDAARIADGAGVL